MHKLHKYQDSQTSATHPSPLLEFSGTYHTRGLIWQETSKEYFYWSLSKIL